MKLDKIPRKMKKKNNKINLILNTQEKVLVVEEPIKMKHLVFDYMDAYDVGDTRHAQEVISELGIKYEFAVHQSMGDCFWFFNCENIPPALPSYIRYKTFSISDYNYWRRY